MEAFRHHGGDDLPQQGDLHRPGCVNQQGRQEDHPDIGGEGRTGQTRRSHQDKQGEHEIRTAWMQMPGHGKHSRLDGITEEIVHTHDTDITAGLLDEHDFQVVGRGNGQPKQENNDHEEQEAAGLHDGRKVSGTHALGRTAAAFLVRQKQADHKRDQ